MVVRDIKLFDMETELRGGLAESGEQMSNMSASCCHAYQVEAVPLSYLVIYM